MKRVVAKIPTIAELREIPETMLPAALQLSKLPLKRIHRIDIEYQPRPKAYFELFKFMRQSVPSLKYHNPSLVVNRRVFKEGPPIPKVRFYSGSGQLLEEFEANKFKTVNELSDKVKQVDEAAKPSELQGKQEQSPNN